LVTDCLIRALFSAEAEAEAKARTEKDNFKGDSKFATHLKASTGVSAFAKSRTLREQREYLPAFACREDLMRVVRDNQGMLVTLSF
jgi:pre-mRNA-splicing factor ATP-dependent RNA helicase DHX38/PRP16